MANYQSLKNWIEENITLQFIFVNVTVEKNVSLQLHALLMAMLFPVVVETKRIKLISLQLIKDLLMAQTSRQFKRIGRSIRTTLMVCLLILKN